MVFRARPNRLSPLSTSAQSLGVAALLFAACSPGDGPQVESQAQPLSALGYVMHYPENAFSPITEVRFCFDNQELMTGAQYAAYRANLASAAHSWSEATDGRLRIIADTVCGDGIRLKVEQLDGASGRVSGSLFDKVFNTGLGKKAASFTMDPDFLGSMGTYRHEMGHALGFAHEQRHPDNTCPEQQEGPFGIATDTKGDIYWEYDHTSVMNYCGGDDLSPRDRAGVRRVYGGTGATLPGKGRYRLRTGFGDQIGLSFGFDSQPLAPSGSDTVTFEVVNMTNPGKAIAARDEISIKVDDDYLCTDRDRLVSSRWPCGWRIDTFDGSSHPGVNESVALSRASGGGRVYLWKDSFNLITVRSGSSAAPERKWQLAFRFVGPFYDKTPVTVSYLPVTPSPEIFGRETQGWRVDRHPRFLGDIDNDGRLDIVGIGESQVLASLGRADGTFSPQIATNSSFTATAGWQYPRHLRFLSDVNGDRRADLVGITEGAVVVALSKGDGTFGNYIPTHTIFAPTTQGWDLARHPRTMADVNGDGRTDLVGFGEYETLVSLAQSDGKFGPQKATPEIFTIGKNGWLVGRHPRLLGDVSGDGKADIVGFGEWETLVSLSNGDGTFGTPHSIGAAFSASVGWDDRTPRVLADVNGDGKADIVGFGPNGVWVAMSFGDGRFSTALFTPGIFGADSEGWSSADHPRFVADVNGDGMADLIGISDGIHTAISRGDGTFWPRHETPTLFGNISQGWSTKEHPRMAADLDGDGRAEIVGFAGHATWVSRPAR